jgi:hypothetical protein
MTVESRSAGALAALCDDVLDAVSSLDDSMLEQMTTDQLHLLFGQMVADVEESLAEGDHESMRDSVVMLTSVLMLIHQRVTGVCGLKGGAHRVMGSK